MSTENPILSAIGQKLDLAALPTANACGTQISLQDWSVGVNYGQLQGSVNLVPASSQDAIVTATLVLGSQDGTSIYTSSVATVVGGGAPGQQVSLQTYTNLFDAATNGSTVTAVVNGYMLTASGGCSFYFVQKFQV